jgi:hypothetical protein
MAACIPVDTTPVPLEAGVCPVPDGSLDGACYPQAVPASALKWVPPHPHQSACSASDLAKIGSESAPVLSDSCVTCLDSTIYSTEYGAEVAFPQVTFPGYAFSNVAGCIATLEPCNQPCAQLLEQTNLCVNEACLPSCKPVDNTTYDNMIACLSVAEQGCPCSAIAEAANECFQEIIDRNSPAAACVGMMVFNETHEQAFLLQAQAVATVLCGAVDGG